MFDQQKNVKKGLGKGIKTNCVRAEFNEPYKIL